MQISASIEINATADAVWQVVRDFNGLPNWIPAVTGSAMEGEGPGAVRVIKTADGAEMTERLESFDDHGRALSYSLVEGPLPVKDYRAILSVTPTEDTRCVVDWTCTCQADGIPEEQLRPIIETLYNGGLEALKAQCSA